VPEDGGGLHEVQVRMFRAIDAVPGLSVRDIAGALGITSQHALYHLRALAAQGYVRLERRGLALRCYAEPGKGPALHEESDGENG
ncbi:MAG TPA: winged helix-turn-helix domain-containing protein, partial [Thermoplasmata archaeon]|nr:winged helix-turn-helix domain-containing protein [Thermoplasmata archaeon]